MYPEIHLSTIGKVRLQQCKNVEAEVRTVRKDDKGHRLIDNDKQHRDTARIP